MNIIPTEFHTDTRSTAATGQVVGVYDSNDDPEAEALVYARTETAHQVGVALVLAANGMEPGLFASESDRTVAAINVLLRELQVLTVKHGPTDARVDLSIIMGVAR